MQTVGNGRKVNVSFGRKVTLAELEIREIRKLSILDRLTDQI